MARHVTSSIPAQSTAVVAVCIGIGAAIGRACPTDLASVLVSMCICGSSAAIIHSLQMSARPASKQDPAGYAEVPPFARGKLCELPAFPVEPPVMFWLPAPDTGGMHIDALAHPVS
ncbi:hypothetical protein PF005_g5955 [Phytophthora fragariae]|uniref:Uncharacterized protein n=1 Tax=Phytophthora fragariae TaxID=53985 RepID=A0A6A3SYJ2_9STRA|nr:hypothetical protein PF003_g37505 [Phytophthora fragariae]KAE8943566.1 hypothetical protein PF009_g6712 [Phytophthora fragariae]KAE8980652.1 hypothetical protein PF011_g22347 [Phytophthora fragariae]KAE9125905.1 hypothetical protein PF007_g6175 [Phytophthora fragariae]KAE9129773.1 hypothetical protein PF010_g4064 [Phytophthora fragariae]